MGYTERRVAPAVEVWRSTGTTGPTRVLPDGCVDLLFDGHRLLVAGPDTVAKVHDGSSPFPLWGVRMHAGLGPLRLGVAAHELCDRLVPLEQVWGDRRAGGLTDRVALDPEAALAAWATPVGPPPLGARLVAVLGAGSSVAAAADRLGLSTRQLHRRTLPVFGYGPQHLGRVLRLHRALGAADRGLGWAEVAHTTGFADQAHLARDVRALIGLSPSALWAERVRSVQDGAASAALASPAWTPPR